MTKHTGKRLPSYMLAFDEDDAESFRKETADGHYKLYPSERWWSAHGPLLGDHGYQLRPRLRPGWIPSWEGTNINPLFCEDSLNSTTRKVIDAVRVKDQKPVFIMQLEKGSTEGVIYRHLADAERQGGVERHIVPLLDSFCDDREPEREFFVMPMLRDCDNPPFETVSEILDFFKQMLECLVYMHASGVAHRDCSLGNIMMDAPGVFPRGFHPYASDRDRGGRFEIKTIPRRKSCKPVCYYIIDFGISRIYSPDDPHLVVGDDGADRDVPEMSDFEFYDPFPADVFIMGNAFKKYFLEKHENLDFLLPLVESMTAKAPADRPNASRALQEFEAVIKRQGLFTLRRRLVPQGMRRSCLAAAIENMGVVVETALYTARCKRTKY